MDIRCLKCSEPWDLDEIHDRTTELNPGQPWYGFPFVNGRGTYDQEVYDRYFKPIMRDFQTRGCPALGGSHGEVGPDPIASAAYELMGDDLDGAASMMEDWGLLR